MRSVQTSTPASALVVTTTHELRTDGHDACVDITAAVQRAVEESRLVHGQATVFVPGSTAGVTTVEFEEGVVGDLQQAVRRLIPEQLRYRHHETAGDDNGHAHVRAALLGPSLVVPVVHGRLALGTWQQIIFVDFDTHPRSRTYLVQLLGAA